MDTVKGIIEFGAKRNTGEILDDYTSYLEKVSKTEDRSEEEVLLDKSFNKVIFELFFRVHEIDCSINKIRGISNDPVKTSILKSDLVKLFISEGYILSDLVDYIVHSMLLYNYDIVNKIISITIKMQQT